eukprot:662454_1
MENITTEDPIQYACWQCLGSFPTSDCLFNHLATVHDAEKDGESVESDDELVASGLALTACDKSSGCQESVSASSSPIISVCYRIKDYFMFCYNHCKYAA